MIGLGGERQTKKPEWGRRGGKAGFSPGGSHVDPICTESGLQGLGLSVRRGLPRGVSEITGHTEWVDDALIEYGFHACAS